MSRKRYRRSTFEKILFGAYGAAFGGFWCYFSFVNVVPMLLDPETKTAFLIFWIFPAFGVVAIVWGMRSLVSGIRELARRLSARRRGEVPSSSDSRSGGERLLFGLTYLLVAAVTDVMSFRLAPALLQPSEDPMTLIFWLVPAVGVSLTIFSLYNISHGIIDLVRKRNDVVYGEVSPDDADAVDFERADDIRRPSYSDSGSGRFCPWCGAVREHGRKYCRQCGGEIYGA